MTKPEDDIAKFDLRSEDVAEARRQELLRIFPEVHTESGGINFEALRLSLGDAVQTGPESFGMSWPGKAECAKTIQRQSVATLLPVEEESVNWDTTQNVIIEGDNLEVLKVLQKAYLGKVKMIYIDPPYNTGNDFIYPDTFAENLQTYLEYSGQVDEEGRRFSTNTETSGRFHTKWLNMMYPRLTVARNLLREDGVIYISINDVEVSRLRMICDEIFGEENLVAQIPWQARTSVQIIASAGSGKTEVVSQRVVSLLAEGVPARGIVAFTFTERAAKELKFRIAIRLEQRLGPEAVDQLSGLYVGTIHGYCFQFLQQFVPRYETFDVLDESQHVAFLCREASHLNIKSLVPGNRLFEAIELFNNSVQVLENELLDPASMPDPFKTVLETYLDSLDKYRLLTFGQQIVRSVAALDDPVVASEIHRSLQHLIVDEYQDVNPAQEELIRRLVAGGATLTVVGDDDQAIYQWRGSTVRNIIAFSERYTGVQTFMLDVNRRSLPDIITTAARFSLTIDDRLDKEMKPWRPAEDGHGEEQIVSWVCDTEQDEAAEIARLIANLNASGLPYSDIAILARSRAAYPKILEELTARGIPVQPGGRSGLFEQPEARCIGRMMCWLVGYDWREQRGRSSAIATGVLVEEFISTFSLTKRQTLDLETWLDELKVLVPATDRVANLIGEFYQLLDILNVRDWDMNDPIVVNRLGTLARITNLFIDYESVYKRARPDEAVEGEQVGGQDRGEWYYRNLATFILNYATGEFDGFEGEDDLLIDAVDLTTVHSSKGLEWPAVFIPSLTNNRFPSMYSGRSQEWLVPRDMFDAPRYEGGSDDERRLFYVAMTRARDWLSISRHNKVTKAKVAESPYFPSVGRFFVPSSEIVTPVLKGAIPEDADLLISYSDLASFMECGLAYRLRQRLGFKPQLEPAIGYGKSIHHVMRVVANFTQATGSVPDTTFLNEILDREFFLPNANKVAHRELKDSARKLVSKYINEYGADLHRVWQTEYPFELHLPGVTVSGRADVIIDTGSEGATSLTLIDYKTRTSGESEHDIQLQVYASAGRREGLEVVDAFVHDMVASDRIPVDIQQQAVTEAEAVVVEIAGKIKRREFDASPEKSKCGRCDVRSICAQSASKKK